MHRLATHLPRRARSTSNGSQSSTGAEHAGTRNGHDVVAETGMRTPAVVDVEIGWPIQFDFVRVGKLVGVDAGRNEIHEHLSAFPDGLDAGRILDGCLVCGRASDQAECWCSETEAVGLW